MSGDHASNRPEPVEPAGPLAEVRNDWRWPATGAALIVLAVFAVYWPVLGGPFLWDDFLVVHRNPLVTGELGPASLWFRTDFPLTTMAFWLEWLVWGNHAAGYHVVNVLLHALSALMLWRVLAQLKVPAPWLGAILFGVHPLCVGSVAWISELKNTLSLPFFLLSLFWYVQFDFGRDPLPPAPRPSLRYGLSLLAFVLALLSKTSTVMLPVVLLGCAWWQRGRITARDWLRTGPFFVVALAFGLMTIRFQAQGAIVSATVQSENFWGRLAGAGMALWFYLGKALLPLNLSMIYPRWQIEAGAATSYLPLVLWCGVLAVCWGFRRSWGRHLLFGLGCFTVLLLPVLGFLDMYYLLLSRVSDHLVYLPLTAVVALGAAGLWRNGVMEWWSDGKDTQASTPTLHPSTTPFAPDHVMIRVAVGVLVVGLAVLGNLRARVFVSEESLWQETLHRNPAAWCAHANLGWILAEQQKYEQAIEHLVAALELNPNHAQAHSNLGRVLSLQGRSAEAEPHFQAALKLKPKDVEIRRAYASVLAGQGRREDAVKQLREVLGVRPETAARLQLATLLYQTRKLPEAVAEYRQVLRVRPDDPEALNNLAWLLATCSDERVRSGAEAVRLAEQACRLNKYMEARTLTTLAAAYAEAGRFTEAVETAQRAIDLARVGGKGQLAAVGGQLLKLFQAGKPYHEPAAAATRPGAK